MSLLTNLTLSEDEMAKELASLGYRIVYKRVVVLPDSYPPAEGSKEYSISDAYTILKKKENYHGRL